MNKYVVAKEISSTGSDCIVREKQYLICMDYNPYNKQHEAPDTVFASDAADAFHFFERSAAEMAAVWIGGKVESFP